MKKQQMDFLKLGFITAMSFFALSGILIISSSLTDTNITTDSSAQERFIQQYSQLSSMQSKNQMEDSRYGDSSLSSKSCGETCTSDSDCGNGLQCLGFRTLGGYGPPFKACSLPVENTDFVNKARCDSYPKSCGDSCDPRKNGITSSHQDCPNGTLCINLRSIDNPNDNYRCTAYYTDPIDPFTKVLQCYDNPRKCGDPCVQQRNGSDLCPNGMKCMRDTTNDGTISSETYRCYNTEVTTSGEVINSCDPEPVNITPTLPIAQCGEVCEKSDTNNNTKTKVAQCAPGLECQEGLFPGFASCYPNDKRTCP